MSRLDKFKHFELNWKEKNATPTAALLAFTADERCWSFAIFFNSLFCWSFWNYLKWIANCVSGGCCRCPRPSGRSSIHLSIYLSSWRHLLRLSETFYRNFADVVVVVVVAVAVAVGFVFDLYQVYKIRITWLKYLQQQYIDFVSQMTKLLPKKYFKKGINAHYVRLTDILRLNNLASRKLLEIGFMKKI